MTLPKSLFRRLTILNLSALLILPTQISAKDSLTCNLVEVSEGFAHEKVSVFVNGETPDASSFAVLAVRVEDMPAGTLTLEGNLYTKCATEEIKGPIFPGASFMTDQISGKCNLVGKVGPSRFGTSITQKVESITVTYYREDTRWFITENLAWLDYNGDSVSGLRSASSWSGSYVCY